MYVVRSSLKMNKGEYFQHFYFFDLKYLPRQDFKAYSFHKTFFLATPENFKCNFRLGNVSNSAGIHSVNLLETVSEDNFLGKLQTLQQD